MKLQTLSTKLVLDERVCFRGSEYIGQLSCLAGRFYGHNLGFQKKSYFEPLVHALSPNEGPVESIFNFI